MEASSSTPAASIFAAMRDFLSDLDHSVVASFVTQIDWTVAPRDLAPSSLACLSHLPRAAEAAEGEGAPLARLLAESGPSLRWGQTYDAGDFGVRFMDNYGWTEIFGTRGHFANDSVAGGLLLLGPDIIYPDHHHVAEEVYVPLTGGSEWRMGGGAFRHRRAGEVIHHQSNVSHAMRTLDVPLLALYLWRGGPLAQRSVIGLSVEGGN